MPLWFASCVADARLCLNSLLPFRTFLHMYSALQWMCTRARPCRRPTWLGQHGRLAARTTSLVIEDTFRCSKRLRQAAAVESSSGFWRNLKTEDGEMTSASIWMQQSWRRRNTVVKRYRLRYWKETEAEAKVVSRRVANHNRHFSASPWQKFSSSWGTTT